MATVSAVAESNGDGVILFAFAFPGACGWGPTEAAARERLRWSIHECRDWLVRHDLEPLAPRVDPDDDEIEIDERVPATGDPLDCDSEGFFDYDQAANADDEVARTRTLLEHTRADLLDLVTERPPAVLDRRLVEDRRTIREVVDHVAIAEHWYLTRIELPVDIPADWRDYPKETFERLSSTRADVGIAIGSGTDVAIEAGDIILVENNPLDVVGLIRLSKASYRERQGNLVWVTGDNVDRLPPVASVLAPIGMSLSPAIGAAFMSLSTVIVTVNARRLRGIDLSVNGVE